VCSEWACKSKWQLTHSKNVTPCLWAWHRTVSFVTKRIIWGSVCLFIAAWAIFCYSAAVTISDGRFANLDLDLCLALVAISSEGSFTCYTCCDKGHFIRFHPKDWYPRTTVGFEPAMLGSSDLYATNLTTVPRGHLRIRYI
jgi:hypothetical protein